MKSESSTRAHGFIRHPSSVILHVTGLTGVLILAGVLRFGGITQVGIRFTDEGAYANDARLWHRCANVLLDPDAISAVLRGDKKVFQARMEGLGVDFSTRYLKPCQGYTFLGAAMMFVVGDRPEALPVLNALCGTLSVVLLYMLAATLFDRRIALWAALFLAVSPYHLVYCRSAWAESSAGLFILAAVYFWARGHRGLWSWRRAYLTAGLALGWAMACHFRSAYVLAVLILVDLLAAQGTRRARSPSALRWGEVGRRWALLVAGIAVPLLAIESVFRAARLGATIGDAYLPLITFLEGGWQWATLLGSWAWAFEGSSLYPQVPAVLADYFVHWHGLAAAIVALLGVVIVVRAPGSAKLPAAFVIMTFAIALFQPYTVARAFSATIPFACLCLAVGTQRLVALLSRGLQPARTSGDKERCKRLVTSRGLKPAARACVAVLLVLLVGPSLANSVRLYEKRSHLADACTFVTQRSGRVAVFDDWKYRLYLEPSDTVTRKAYRNSMPAPELLEALRAADVRWLIADPQYWHYRTSDRPWDQVFQWWREIYRHLDEHVVCVARFDHMTDYRWEFLSESPEMRGLRHLAEMTREGAGALRVYDLQTVGPLAEAGEWGAPTTTHLP